MPRSVTELREVNEKLARRIRLEHPGLAAVIILFDAGQRGEQPVSILLHGVGEEQGVKLMRAQADNVEKSRAPAELETLGPLVVKPA